MLFDLKTNKQDIEGKTRSIEGNKMTVGGSACQFQWLASGGQHSFFFSFFFKSETELNASVLKKDPKHTRD